MTAVRNLTRAEAEERARLLAVTAYDISLDLTGEAGGPGEGTFRSITRVEFSCTRPGASTFIEVAAERLRSARLNGRDLDPGTWSAGAGLVLPELAAENTLIVVADFAYSSSGEGLHRSVDPADGRVYLYSQFEIADAQRVYSCFDQPDLKSVYAWHVRVPADWTVVSNAFVERVCADPTGGKTVHFRQSVRLSTYVTALVAGPYHQVRREHDGIDLGLFVRRSMREYLDADELFLVTGQGFDFFHRHFGIRYPLPKYDQVFVPEYNSAAMENFGCVTLGEEYFIYRSRVTEFEYEKRATHVLHELAHMWFGDMVTMRWWDDIWLKESYAEWAAHWCAAAATRYTGAWATFLSMRKNWGYRADQLSSTHPVHTPMPDVASVEANFDGITYAKGACVIKQLVAYLGIDAFLRGLRTYLRQHAWDNATFDDLLAALSEASRLELAGFAAQWLETAQVNTLRPVAVTRPDGTYAHVAIAQQAPEQHPTLRTHRIAIGLYDRHGDRLVRRERRELVVAGELTEVPELAGVPVPDLLLVNDDDLTYAKLRLDPRSLRTVLDSLAGLESPLARALCWAAAWDMTRDAELAARAFVELVCTALPQERDLNLITSVLLPAPPGSSQAGQVQVALDQYADPAWAPAGRQRLAEVARGVLAWAPPGSGVQLAWAQAFIAAARRREDLATLRGWLAGDGVPEGLAVGAELRWSLVSALAALGAAGPDEIDTELARDHTASGQRLAAFARALLPTPEAKATAWARLADPATPNWLRRSLLHGFYHPAQTELTASYLPAYFEAAARLWAAADNQNAQEFAVFAYPAGQVDASVLAASDAWLAGAHPEPLRRLVGNGRDNLARALAARQRDAAAGADGERAAAV